MLKNAYCKDIWCLIQKTPSVDQTLVQLCLTSYFAGLLKAHTQANGMFSF